MIIPNTLRSKASAPQTFTMFGSSRYTARSFATAFPPAGGNELLEDDDDWLLLLEECELDDDE